MQSGETDQVSRDVQVRITNGEASLNTNPLSHTIV